MTAEGCKVCHKNLKEYIDETWKTHEDYIKEAMEQLKNKPCNELLEEMLSTASAFWFEAAKRLLLERGHSQEELRWTWTRYARE